MKKLRIAEEDIPQLVQNFEQWLKTAKIADGKLNFSKNIIPTKVESDNKPVVLFKEMAWLKIKTLVRMFDTEVAWHGTVNRVDETHFEITDIMVYPQTVTGATVNTDQAEYEMWLMRQPDEVFNAIRFQAHSHVNMAVSPSATDETHQKKIVDQLGPDDFYIFMIINKRDEFHVRIYDMKTNLLYEPADVVIQYEPNELDNFIAVSNAQVQKKTYVGTGYNYGGYNYGKYSGTNLYSGQTKAANAPATTQVPTKSAETKSASVNDSMASGKQVMAETSEDDDDAWWEWYDRMYGNIDDEEEDYNSAYLPGYPNYNRAVGKKKNSKKVKNKYR